MKLSSLASSLAIVASALALPLVLTGCNSNSGTPASETTNAATNAVSAPAPAAPTTEMATNTPAPQPAASTDTNAAPAPSTNAAPSPMTNAAP